MNFSRKYGYLLCRLVRRLAVLSGFSSPTPFTALLVIETLFIKSKTTTFDLLESCFPKKEKKPTDG